MVIFLAYTNKTKPTEKNYAKNAKAYPVPLL